MALASPSLSIESPPLGVKIKLPKLCNALDTDALLRTTFVLAGASRPDALGYRPGGSSERTDFLHDGSARSHQHPSLCREYASAPSRATIDTAIG
ncbi:MAG TPA: hypothetical protein VIV60_12195 [Polyangiaceae bacterium]